MVNDSINTESKNLSRVRRRTQWSSLRLHCYLTNPLSGKILSYAGGLGHIMRLSLMIFHISSHYDGYLIVPDVILSGIGALLWTAVLLAWVITFQTQRAAWGEFGDSISYLIPEGIP